MSQPDVLASPYINAVAITDVGDGLRTAYVGRGKNPRVRKLCLFTQDKMIGEARKGIGYYRKNLWKVFLWNHTTDYCRIEMYLPTRELAEAALVKVGRDFYKGDFSS